MTKLTQSGRRRQVTRDDLLDTLNNELGVESDNNELVSLAPIEHATSGLGTEIENGAPNAKMIEQPKLL